MNVLIVDDNQDNRTTITLLLESFENLEIFEVEDGQEAIDICSSRDFDIIFMDIMMPNVDGIEATKEIKKSNKGVMILALSALDDEESKYAMLAAGAEDYITKPIESELFNQRVKNYLQIIAFRKLKPSNENALNPFTNEVYSRSLKFNITNAQSLAEFWDYYLNDLTLDIEDLEECIRMIYAYAQMALKHGQDFSITTEENSHNLYFILSSIRNLSETVVKHTLLKHYDHAVYMFTDKHLSFRLPKNVPFVTEKSELKELSSEDKTILSKTHFNKITALEYVESTAVSLIDKIESLEDSEDQLEAAAVIYEQHASEENLTRMRDLIDVYVDVIKELLDFEHFAYALANLNSFLKTLDVSQIDEQDNKKFIFLFLHLLDDIAAWRKNIFILQEANDIHYLDSSLLSSCLQVQSIFDKIELSQDDEGDFELF